MKLSQFLLLVTIAAAITYGIGETQYLPYQIGFIFGILIGIYWKSPDESDQWIFTRELISEINIPGGEPIRVKLFVYLNKINPEKVDIDAIIKSVDISTNDSVIYHCKTDHYIILAYKEAVERDLMGGVLLESFINKDR